ncbi:MAG TPA: FMN-binding protein [Bacteroidales bacterium]|jgi:major membrane immunogen (membrane-anchored lipoprotein)|nr:FMN-binding protein [Bacteroidales bacterium]
MKKAGFIFSLFLISNIIFCQNYVSKSDTSATRYPDGNYSGSSRSIYEGEPYWGIIRMNIKDGKFTDVSFMIRDSALHETFNDGYARHFAGNEVYIQQTKNDWNGVRTYPSRLMEKQDIEKVDVITGATWSYNIFRASFTEALKKNN